MTPRSSRLPMLAFLVGLAILIAAISAQANGRTFVYVNGYELSAQELYAVQMQSGMRIPPGNYIVDGQSGCWAELNTGRSGCTGQSGGGSYTSRYGSGESNANGDWNHWSNAAGGAVGGTGDGCVYTTFGWSNC